MTEQEYCDLSDLQRLRDITSLFRSLHLTDDKHRAKLKGASENLYQIIDDLEPKVSAYLDKEE